MGQTDSTPKPNTGRRATSTTAAPTTTSAPCLSNNLADKEYLILAFCSGVLLTLLLLALAFLVIKSYKKCCSSPQALEPHSGPPAKLSSIPEESLTYARMTFKTSEEKGNHLTKNCSADSDLTVYTQIKAAHSLCLSDEA
ncbi:transmembrane protein C1orf162 homolog [Microcebus murinus]|uniref:Chromosome 1 open reading frame 162 n=1 Tax=Microcebus murinus TaxID=30608 RepID=A0A8B7FGK2_MICMU|nr:transmembrane protein C1orf162 homolog [Microcebus murinus]XP_012607085.1 transmembrane protein C1orf162 homolog [Microcebus murinus]